MTLGENIVRLRTQKNWSQGDLADALDISRQSVSKWETDASIPELDKLLKLSELFGVTLDELVRGEDAPKAETAAPAAQAVPASFTPQTSSEQEKRHTIAGTILLCIGAVLLLTCLILAGDLLAGLIYGLPFFLCGIICFTVKHRTGLWCGWAAYLCIDLYLRFATGLSWTTVFMTHLWTAQMNYARLAISWVQLLGMLVMIVCTALLPDAQAAHDEKRGHMAHCRLARGARCAAASDELRCYAAAARRSRQLQQHFAVLPSECPVQLCAPCARQHPACAHARRLALEAGREESKDLNRNEKKRTALRSAFLMQICLTSCSSPARRA